MSNKPIKTYIKYYYLLNHLCFSNVLNVLEVSHACKLYDT